jgi:hypothetical protein
MPTIDTSTYDVIVIGAGPAGEITDRPSGSSPPPSSHGDQPVARQRPALLVVAGEHLRYFPDFGVSGRTLRLTLAQHHCFYRV